MQLVVPIAVRNAVSAATITFTANSITLCFFMIRSFFKFALVEGGGWRVEGDMFKPRYSALGVSSSPPESGGVRGGLIRLLFTFHFLTFSPLKRS